MQPPPLPSTLADGASTRRPRLQLWMLLAFGVMLGVFGLLGVAGMAFFISDGPPPTDAHLQPRWSERGGNDNPLARFCFSLDRSKVQDIGNLDASVRKGEPGTEEQVQAFLDTQKEVFEAFDELMRTDPLSWQWPHIDRMVKDDTNASRYLSSSQALGSVLKLKAHVLRQRGETAEALKVCLQLARMSDGMLHAEGGPIHLLVAVTLLTMAESELLLAMRTEEISRPLLEDCLRRLTEIPGPSREDLRFALKVDYLYFSTILDQARNQGRVGGQSMGATPLDIFIKKNRTLAQRALHLEAVCRGLDQTWREALAAAREGDAMRQKMKDARKSPGFYLDPNIGGKILNEMSMLPLETLVQRSMSTESLRQQVRVALTLRLYELDHGHLPVTLDDLSPRYLSTVPEDIYTGGSMLWNRESGVIYSVGGDAKDNGGKIDRKNFSKGADLGVDYPWAVSQKNKESKTKER